MEIDPSPRDNLYKRYIKGEYNLCIPGKKVAKEMMKTRYKKVTLDPLLDRNLISATNALTLDSKDSMN